jgi:hypothetical protein
MEPIPFQTLGKVLIFIGTLIMLLGVLFYYGNKIPLLGHLPGDIIIKRKNFTFYFPITTLIILNIVIYLFYRLLKR